MRASSAAARGSQCGAWVGNALLLQPVRFDRATELMHRHADKTGKPE